MAQNDLTIKAHLFYSGIFFGSLSYLNIFYFFSKIKLNRIKNIRQITYNIKKNSMLNSVYTSKKQGFSTNMSVYLPSKNRNSNSFNLVKHTHAFEK